MNLVSNYHQVRKNKDSCYKKIGKEIKLLKNNKNISINYRKN